MSSFEQTAEERALLLEKAKRRAALRSEFLKQTSNPFRHGEGGHLFDSALLRHQSMRISAVDYFRPTTKSLRSLLLVVVPMLTYGYWIKSDRDRREQEYRTGQISYKDRRFKFI
ncbi:uncharacterized protein LOC119069717 [Bradysia coprophila]|uniref:uncharacterized protein LOC119069717 n=1 Tax=Bradysia coprophila TaxID=38358 RepID=UPI00187D7108|nr:uncharacterized protein LOC119069717 [Bradysia coprophila]